jgi:hypothetical protein
MQTMTAASPDIHVGEHARRTPATSTGKGFIVRPTHTANLPAPPYAITGSFSKPFFARGRAAGAYFARCRQEP